MKFRHLDVIRHKNGCAVFDVVSADTEQDMYTLRCPASYVVHTLASNLVDSMFIGVFPLDESGPMKFEEQVAAFQVKYVPGPSLAQKLSAVWDTSKVFTAQPLNPTLPIAPDVAVSLPGLPSGYYLKAFRKALPGDLVLNTSGAVVPAIIRKNWGTLYRPVVGKVSDIRKGQFQLPGVPEGWEAVSYRSPVEGEHYLGTYTSEVLEASKGRPIPTGNWPIVKPVPSLTPCDGTLPGIPKEYKLVGFGAVKEDQFFIDTVGTLKPGPAKNRLVLEPLQVKQPEVVTEYEIDCWGGTVWAVSDRYVFSHGTNIRYTGRTRKVVVQ